LRISNVLGAVNWRHAIGEMGLIVVGVMIALAATSWYEDLQLPNMANQLVFSRSPE
jgi:hypothetical protein